MKLEIEDTDTAIQIAKKLMVIEDEMQREYRKRVNLAKMAQENNFDESWLTEPLPLFALNTLKLMTEIIDTRSYVIKLFNDHADPASKMMLRVLTALATAAKQ